MRVYEEVTCDRFTMARHRRNGSHGVDWSMVRNDSDAG